jgi:hypothetical protein
MAVAGDCLKAASCAQETSPCTAARVPDLDLFAPFRLKFPKLTSGQAVRTNTFNYFARVKKKPAIRPVHVNFSRNILAHGLPSPFADYS